MPKTLIETTTQRDTELQSIHITRPLALHLLSLAQRSAYQKIGGVIAAHGEKPCTVYPLDNVAHDPQTRYCVDLEQRQRILTVLANKRERLFAYYHSQPQGPVQITAESLQAMGFDTADQRVYQLILSLNIKGVLELRAFAATDHRWQEVNLAL